MNDEPKTPPTPSVHQLLQRPAAPEAPQNDDWNRSQCSLFHAVIDGHLSETCSGKVNAMEPGSGNPHCPCEPSDPTKIDDSTRADDPLPAKPGCVEARLPSLFPCIHVSWGDSDCDCMESDDVETICVTVCNCYTNVTFADLSIQIAWVLDDDNTLVATLPDGTPSVEVIPPGPICFGDVGPCVDGRKTCVSRQLVVRNRGAKAGHYKLVLAGVCFDLVHHYFIGWTEFAFDVCKD